MLHTCMYMTLCVMLVLLAGVMLVLLPTGVYIMYYITYTDKKNNTITINDLPLARAIVYKKRYRKRGIVVVITPQG